MGARADDRLAERDPVDHHVQEAPDHRPEDGRECDLDRHGD
jgi:hypothetical protein